MELPGSRPVSAARRGVVALLCSVAVTGQAAAAESSRAPADSTPGLDLARPQNLRRSAAGSPGAGRAQNVELDLRSSQLKTPDAYKYDPATGQPDPTAAADRARPDRRRLGLQERRVPDSWAEPSCKRGGFFSVDITDPENPEQLAFVPALPGHLPR